MDEFSKILTDFVKMLLASVVALHLMSDNIVDKCAINGYLDIPFTGLTIECSIKNEK